MPRFKCRPLHPFSIDEVARFQANIRKGAPDECWPWTGRRDAFGYGIFISDAGAFQANRVAYFLSTGVDPGEAFVCHSCHYPPCCNDKHLHLGTHETNMREMAESGRAASGDRNGARLHPETRCRGDRHWMRLYPERIPRGDDSPSRRHPERMARGDKNGSRLHPEKLKRGEDHPNAAFTTSQIQEIRSRYAKGDISQTQLAREFNTTQAAIHLIVRRKLWKHI